MKQQYKNHYFRQIIYLCYFNMDPPRSTHEEACKSVRVFRGERPVWQKTGRDVEEVTELTYPDAGVTLNELERKESWKNVIHCCAD